MRDKVNSFTGKIIEGVGYVRVPNPPPQKRFSFVDVVLIVALIAGVCFLATR